MNLKQLKINDYIVSGVLEFGFALTASSVMLVTMKTVASDEYNIAQILGGIISFGVTFGMASAKIRKFFLRYATHILVFDLLSFLFVQYISYYSLVARLILISTLFPIVMALRSAIVMDRVNMAMSGDVLSNYNQTKFAFERLGACLGYIASIYLSKHHELILPIALGIQGFVLLPDLLIAYYWTKYKCD